MFGDSYLSFLSLFDTQSSEFKCLPEFLKFLDIMSTSNLSELYAELCKKHHIEVQECVQIALQNGAVLDLANQTLDVGTCAVVGKVLQVSHTVNKLSFEDCLLREEGMISLLLGLCGNCSVQTLSLKGNTIQGAATHALAKMVRHNHTIVRLSLEWNSLGMCPDSFASFCEALCSSSSLQYLDLRSNQLSIDTATHLVAVLARNCSLLSVDLRWNGLSAAGGKALLGGLRHNHTLTKLNLTGNNVSAHIISAIDAQLNQNARGCEVQQEYTSRTNLLKQQLEDHQRHSAHQLEQLEQSLAQRDTTLDTTLREGMFRVGQLEEEVRARTQELEAMTAKYELVSSALRMSQERVSSLEGTLATQETQLHRAQEAALSRHKEDREALERTVTEHNLEMRTLQKTITQLEAQVGELEFKCENQKKQIFDYKETMCSLQSEVKGVRLECEDIVVGETGKHKEAVKQMEQQHNTEVQRLRNQHNQLETELRETVRGSETQRSELEAEVTSLRLQVSTERSSTQTQLHSLKQQLKAEHSTAKRSLEEQLQVSIESREETEERLRGQVAANTALTTANARFGAQARTLANDLVEMRASVERKEEEVREAERRVRGEYAGQVEELRQGKEQAAKLRDTIVELKRRLSEVKGERDDRLREARTREEDAQRHREDEARRVGLLHSAFLSYFSCSSSQPLPGPPTTR